MPAPSRPGSGNYSRPHLLAKKIKKRPKAPRGKKKVKKRSAGRNIPALADVLLGKMTGNGRSRCRLDKETLNALKHYGFPGNVRELRNLLQRASVHCKDGLIRVSDLNLETPPHPDTSSENPSNKKLQPASLSHLEKNHISELLEQHAGHRRTVAAILGVTERTLYRKIKQHGLK